MGAAAACGWLSAGRQGSRSRGWLSNSALPGGWLLLKLGSPQQRLAEQQRAAGWVAAVKAGVSNSRYENLQLIPASRASHLSIHILGDVLHINRSEGQKGAGNVAQQKLHGCRGRPAADGKPHIPSPPSSRRTCDPRLMNCSSCVGQGKVDVSSIEVVHEEIWHSSRRAVQGAQQPGLPDPTSPIPLDSPLLKPAHAAASAPHLVR